MAGCQGHQCPVQIVSAGLLREQRREKDLKWGQHQSSPGQDYPEDIQVSPRRQGVNTRRPSVAHSTLTGGLEVGQEREREEMRVYIINIYIPGLGNWGRRGGHCTKS